MQKDIYQRHQTTARNKYRMAQPDTTSDTTGLDRKENHSDSLPELSSEEESDE